MLTYGLADKLKSFANENASKLPKTAPKQTSIVNKDAILKRMAELQVKIAELQGGPEDAVVANKEVWECLSCSAPTGVDKFFCGECDEVIKQRAKMPRAPEDD